MGRHRAYKRAGNHQCGRYCPELPPRDERAEMPVAHLVRPAWPRAMTCRRDKTGQHALKVDCSHDPDGRMNPLVAPHELHRVYRENGGNIW